MLSYWPADGSDISRSPTIALPMSGFPHRDELIDRYRQRGFDVASIDWYEAFGLLKLAVVLKQLHSRNHADPRYAGFEASADDVLKSAAEMASQV